MGLFSSKPKPGTRQENSSSLEIGIPKLLTKVNQSQNVTVEEHKKLFVQAQTDYLVIPRFTVVAMLIIITQKVVRKRKLRSISRR